jgi:uncharacterized membrane protein
MKNRILIPACTLIVIFAIISSCKEENTDDDCSGVTGATFSSNAGKVQNILAAKCAVTTCHAAGGAGTAHWTYSAEYDSISEHFHHMYEAVIEEGEMPPDTAVQLTQEEINVFKCWEQSGFPE